MDRLEAMAMLVETVDAGSLSAAGRRLGVPLPTLSRRISDLEAQLGVTLLLRSTRRLVPTPAGESYVAASRQILERVAEADREAAGEYDAPRGELVLSAPMTFGRLHVLPVVAAFLAAHDDIRVRLVLSDDVLQLVEERVDMVVRFGALPDSTLTATRVGSMRRVLCASPALLAAAPVSTPHDLAGLPCVTFDRGPVAARWSFRAPGDSGDFEVAIRSRLSVTTAEAAVDAAIAGVGVTRVLLYQAAAALARGDLVTICADWDRTVLPCHLVHAARGQLPLKMRRFLDFAAPRVRETLLALETR